MDNRPFSYSFLYLSGRSGAGGSAAALLLFFFLGLLPAAPCRGASQASLVMQGNKAYGEADYKEALDLYNQAAEAGKETSTVIEYDRGNVLYRLNDFEGARKAYEKAAQERKNKELAARSYYNMGNAAFKQGEALAQQAPDKAMTAFTGSAAAYREALRLKPQLSGAGANLELTNRRIKELAVQLQQQQQQSSPGKQGKSPHQTKNEDSQSLHDLALRQKQLAEATEKLQNGQRQGKKEQKQAVNTLAEDQQRLRQETEQQMQQKAGQEQNVQPEDDLKSATKLQQQAEEKLRSEDLHQAAELQKQAAEKLRQAAEKKRQLTGNSGNNQVKKKSEDKEPSVPEKQAQARKQPETAGDQSKQTTPPALDPREILNQEKMQRQLHRQRMLSSGGRQVEKDW